MNFTVLLFNLKLVDIISKHGCVLETGKKKNQSAKVTLAVTSGLYAEAVEGYYHL